MLTAEIMNSSGMVPDNVNHTLSYGAYLASGIYLATIGVGATLGNLLVIVVIFTNRKRINFRKKQHVPLLLNLAVADIGVSVFGYPYSSTSELAGRWLFTDAVCIMSGFSCFLLSMVSLNTLVAVSIYRYIAICKPGLSRRLSAKTTSYVALLTWVYAFAWTVVPLLGPAAYTYEPFGTSCSIEWRSRRLGDVIYIVLVDIFCFLLHISIIIFCYVQIIRRYRYISDPTTPGPGSNQSLSKLRAKRDMHVTWLVMVQVGAFLLAWTPYAVVSAWFILHNLPLWATLIPTHFAKLSCALNPLIYCALNKTFRHMCRNILCRCLLRRISHSAEKYSPDVWHMRGPSVRDIFCVTRGIPEVPLGVAPIHRATSAPAELQTQDTLRTQSLRFSQTLSLDRGTRQRPSVANVNPLGQSHIGGKPDEEEPKNRFPHLREGGQVTSSECLVVCPSRKQVSVSGSHNSLLKLSVGAVLRSSNNMCRNAWSDNCSQSPDSGLDSMAASRRGSF